MKRIRDFKQRIGSIAGKDLVNNPNDVLQTSTDYRFLTGIVTETVSNPHQYLNRQFQIDGNAYNGVTIGDVLSGRIESLPDGKKITSPIKNFYHVSNMPMNSSLVQIIDDSRTKSGEKMIVAYPFFPPHLSLPLKAGEYVWIIQEDIKGIIYYYWMCRKVGIVQVDDINFTNLERTPIISSMYDKYSDSGKVFEPASDTLEKMVSLGKSDTSNLSSETYADILKSSYGYVNEFIGEPVPRIMKDCGDLLLQGSNNAGVHLTTEKFTSFSEEVDPTSPPNSEKTGKSAIDLFVGRSKTNQPEIKNKSDSDPQVEHLEIDKINDIRTGQDPITISLEELTDDTPDIAEARLYISQFCKFDAAFGSGDSIDPGLLTSHDGSCVIAYANSTRMVGRESTRLVSVAGENFVDLQPEGDIVIKAAKNNGQQYLSLTPGSGGYSRINSAGKIYLTHGSNNNLPGNSDEPYVLVSQLEEILSVVFDVLNSHANLMIGLAPLRFPPMIAAAAQLINQLLGTDAPKIATPTTKYTPRIDLPPIAAPYSAKAAIVARILRHSHIIADKG